MYNSWKPVHVSFSGLWEHLDAIPDEARPSAPRVGNDFFAYLREKSIVIDSEGRIKPRLMGGHQGNSRSLSWMEFLSVCDIIGSQCSGKVDRNVQNDLKEKEFYAYIISDRLNLTIVRFFSLNHKFHISPTAQNLASASFLSLFSIQWKVRN